MRLRQTRTAQLNEITQHNQRRPKHGFWLETCSAGILFVLAAFHAFRARARAHVRHIADGRGKFAPVTVCGSNVRCMLDLACVYCAGVRVIGAVGGIYEWMRNATEDTGRRTVEAGTDRRPNALSARASIRR